MPKLLPILIFVFLLTAASAQQVPPAATAEASVLKYGDSEKTCLEWNDGCRTCRRPEPGEAVCSNIGIACQPQTIACTRRIESPKAEPPK